MLTVAVCWPTELTVDAYAVNTCTSDNLDLGRRCVGERTSGGPGKLSHLAHGWDAKCHTSIQQASDSSATDDTASLDAVSHVAGPEGDHAKPRRSCSMEQHSDSDSVQRRMQQRPSTVPPVAAIVAAREDLPSPAVDRGAAAWIPGDTHRRYSCFIVWSSRYCVTVRVNAGCGNAHGHITGNVADASCYIRPDAHGCSRIMQVSRCCLVAKRL